MYLKQEILGRKSKWREYLRADADARARELRIGLSASFTVEPLLPFLGTEVMENGYDPVITIAPYNQLFQSCLDPEAAFELQNPDCLCFLWRIDDIAERELRDWLSGDASAIDALDRKLGDFQAALRALSAQQDCPIIVSLPPYPNICEASLRDLNVAASLGTLHRHVVNRWIEMIGEIEKVHVLDLDALERCFGVDRSFDTRKWYLYKQPFSDEFYALAGNQLGRILRALYLPAKKCIAIDCDNTIWGGTIGEDGLEGIALGDEFPGKAFVDLQRYLLHLKEQGVLIAILSKNNEADVWEVFERHDAMSLSRPDIAASRINWDEKSTNLRQVADELNIGIDSFVFLDDNPFEIEQMRAALPEVQSILLSEEPADMVSSLKDMHLFDRLIVSEEDRNRTKMITQERERSALSGSLSAEDFLQSLELNVALFRPGHEHTGRVAQLINKTNQFNLTTIRRTEAEVIALLDSPEYEVFGARITDRFGDYGITGVVVFQKTDRTWNIDTFLLSCRVLGRQVESAILSTLVDHAARSGAERITGRYTPTQKNAPIQNFLGEHGFAASDDSGELALRTATPPTAPAHIEISLAT